MKPSEALDVNRDELRALVARYGFLGARVFGSVVTLTDRDDSDLDLLVEPDPELTTLFTLADFQIEAETLLGVPVDVLTPGALPPKFRDRVLAAAEPL